MGFRQTGPGRPPDASQDDSHKKHKPAAQTEEEKETERRNLRRLQLMVDMVLSVLSQDPDLTRAEAMDMVASCRMPRWECFPTKSWLLT